jgi:hypothetical protein
MDGAKDSSAHNKVTCSIQCKTLLNKIEATYSPTHANINDVFSTLVVQENNHCTDSFDTEINSIFQTLACWGLSRMRNTEDTYAIQEATMFLESLEKSALHLRKGLKCVLCTNE